MPAIKSRDSVGQMGQAGQLGQAPSETNCPASHPLRAWDGGTLNLSLCFNYTFAVPRGC
jgi:hypothetical protein